MGWRLWNALPIPQMGEISTRRRRPLPVVEETSQRSINRIKSFCVALVLMTEVDPVSWPEADPPPSMFQAEDDVNDALDLAEALG
jgi:hypothetical protein